MPLTISSWHARFTQQARWTVSLRQYLYRQVSLANAQRILDVGCGTGALHRELVSQAPKALVTGLDHDTVRLDYAKSSQPGSAWLAGDALALPFSTASCDIVLCHFLLLWVGDPDQAVREMARVARPGGSVIAMAEPDYGGRIDYPPPLARLGALQSEALRRQGADPLLGRRLGELFHHTGLKRVETGVLGGQWHNPPSPAEIDTEWQVLQSDMADMLPAGDLASLRALDQAAWQSGIRTLFVPTFYAIGWNDQ